MRHFYILFIFGLLLASSCEIINPDEGIPAKISISSTTFNTDHLQGTDSADIQDIWIYNDNDLVGAYQIPFTIPILASGSHNLKLRPGVILNGIASTRSINPFYTYVTENVNLVAGETYSFSPKFKYADGVIFPWNAKGEEDFEEGGISIDSVPGSSTKIFKSKADVYEGDYSGEIYLDAGHKTYRGQSSKDFDLPKSGAYVVMEMNVKNTQIPLYIGMYVHLAGNTVRDVSHMMVNPTSDWKKLYVNFTELVSYYPNALSYSVSFKADLGSLDSAKIYVDNIKIMHF
jgi:hypothetical protein